MEEKENNKEQNKIRKIHLDNLPRKEGIGVNKGKMLIDWNSSVGYKVKGTYKEVNFEVEIVKIDKRDSDYIYIKYLDKPLFRITTYGFAKCRLGKLLGFITTNFKIEIGQIFKDDKRDLTITDRKIKIIKRVIYDKRRSKYSDVTYNKKYYKYTCNKCGWIEGYIEEESILQGNGCACCANQIVIEGINDIPTTAPWMVKYFQGGYDEAKLYSKNSHKKIYPICPYCGRVKDKSIIIDNIYNYKSINCNCSDKTPYTEKLMFIILEQLQLNFTTQLSKNTYEWINKYKYDFYFKYCDNEYIIETHGIQHYEQTNRKGARTLEEEQANDEYKKQLALSNGIKEENYMVIDCRYSELEFIKNNILNSNLSKIFDLSKIDWLKCEEFALSNRVKETCNLWNSGIHNTQSIGEIMKLNRNTIVRHLKKGNRLGWCEYDVELELKKYRSKNSKLKGKKVEIFKNGVSLGIFTTCIELERQSEELFGVKLLHSGISQVANGKWEHYKKFTFKYVDKANDIDNISKSA